MCYLCEARGSVGLKYRETQAEIGQGLKSWRQRCGTVSNNDRRPALRADWTKAPPKRKGVGRDG